jgi:hypothetical protein
MMLIIGSGVILTMMMNNHTDCGVSHPRMMVPAGPRRRASRRQSFALPTRDSDLSKRRRQSERLRKLNSVGQYMLSQILSRTRIITIIIDQKRKFSFLTP